MTKNGKIAIFAGVSVVIVVITILAAFGDRLFSKKPEPVQHIRVEPKKKFIAVSPVPKREFQKSSVGKKKSLPSISIKTKPPTVVEAVVIPVEDLFRMPMTREEARRLSRLNYDVAKVLLPIKADSAWKHIQHGLLIYENGSLFRLKALYYMQKDNFAAATTAAEVANGRTDQWDNDKGECEMVLIRAMIELDRKYPSEVLKDKIRKVSHDTSHVSCFPCGK